jgi:beta-glucosidase
VVVLVSGRPLDIAAQLPNWNALLAAWLPGTEGAGVADVLFGDYAPTGTLPMTWMQSASQQPINDGDGKPALFPYGFGLRYGGTRSAYDVIQAERYSAQSGTLTETTTDTGGGQNVGYITAGDWLAYSGLDFGAGAASVTTRWASGSSVSGTVQYRLDSVSGPVIASVPVSNSGGWQSWRSTSTNLSGSASGTHTVYITFAGTGGDLVNLNWFQYAQ